MLTNLGKFDSERKFVNIAFHGGNSHLHIPPEYITTVGGAKASASAYFRNICVATQAQTRREDRVIAPHTCSNFEIFIGSTF
jgi:hypothetical protein